MSDPTTNTNPQKNEGNFIQQSSHPMIAIFTIAFKLGAIISFILLHLFCNNEAIVMIVVIISGACDFWITKNIAGRKLVGLRWWNNTSQANATGDKWVFESKDEQTKTKADQGTFWTSLYSAFIIWVVLFVWELIRLKFIWSTVSLIMTVLSGTNVYGYFRCSRYQATIMQRTGKNIFMSFIKKAPEEQKA